MVAEPATAPAPARRPSIETRFAAFDAAHPEVFAELRRLAVEAVEAGRQRLGLKELWEVARWHLRLQCTDGLFKLNNDFTPLYARKLMETEPALVGVFETRARRSN